MKVKIFAITLFVIGAFIACKKVTETINPTYSDTELKIDSKSAFADEERKIKESIMNFRELSLKDRRAIVDGIVMDNKNVAHIGGNIMRVINKLDKKELINLFRILIPNSNFNIIDGERIIANYHSDWVPCDYWNSYVNRKYESYSIDQCRARGGNLCMQFVPCP